MKQKMETKNETNSTGEKTLDVLVIGEINVDLILKGNVEPLFGQIEQIVDQADLVMGSSAVIFACGAARLGLKTAFIGVAGDDVYGHFMLESMQCRDIDTSGVVLDSGMQTGISVILARPSDRAILTLPGSIPELQYSHLDFSLFDKAKHLHLSSYFMLDKLRPDVARIFRYAHACGLSISLDTNYDPSERWNDGLHDVIRLADVFLPNDTEIIAISAEKNLEEAMSGMLELTPLVAVKRGKQGASAQRRGENRLHQASMAVEVADTVGAGDSFDAGFIYAYLHNWDMAETLKLAVACGSLSTRQAGGTNAQPDLDEALKFIRLLE